MDNGYMIREKNHQTSKVWAFWACQSAAQTKSIYDEKNVAQTPTVGNTIKGISKVHQKIRGAHFNSKWMKISFVQCANISFFCEKC